MVPLLPLKAVGGGDAATSVELFYASAAAAAVVAADADACRKQFAVRCLNISLDGSKTLPATKWQRCLLLISIATSAAAAASGAEAR